MTLKQATRQRLLEESPSKFQLGYSIFVTMFGAVVRIKKPSVKSIDIWFYNYNERQFSQNKHWLSSKRLVYFRFGLMHCDQHKCWSSGIGNLKKKKLKAEVTCSKSIYFWFQEKKRDSRCKRQPGFTKKKKVLNFLFFLF